jgi:hypothetical protein
VTNRVYIVEGSHVFHSRRDCHYLALSHSGWSSRLLGSGGQGAEIIRGGLRKCRRCHEMERDA